MELEKPKNPNVPTIPNVIPKHTLNTSKNIQKNGIGLDSISPCSISTSFQCHPPSGRRDDRDDRDERNRDRADRP